MGLVGGGTWAYFSDPEVTGVNVLSAGTLDLDLADGDDTAPVVLSVSNKAPGDTGNGTVTLDYAGSLDGELDITFGTVNNVESSGGTEYEGLGSGELGANLEIAPFIDLDEDNAFDAGSDIALTTTSNSTSTAALQWGTLDNFSGKTWSDVYSGTVSSGESDTFVLAWRIATSVGNDIQGDSANATITFTLEQAAAD
jgi:predicted ribosomally synthesized peptide with SipW-like signal peptide